MTMKKPQELDIPPKALSDPDSQEILRIWLANGEQHVCLKHEICDDPAAWGLLLVDIARHVANAYDQAGKKPFNTVINRIRCGFDMEWDQPTDQARGTLE